MGIEHFQISLDNPSDEYYPGSAVSGKVQFYLDKPKKIRAVKIHFHGEAKTSFSGTRTVKRGDERKTETVTFHASEEYFSINYNLVGSSDKHVTGEMELQPGEYIYPFTTTLPPALPSSFESEHGHIRYIVKAKVNIPWGIDDKVEKTFRVVSPVDLNYMAEAKEPITRQVEKSFCCLWCRSGPLTIVLSLPHLGYVPGENIPVTLEVDNVSDVNVDNVVIKLKKITKWRAHAPENETKENTTDLVEISLGPVGCKDSRTFSQQFSVPVVPVFNLQQCSIINCNYIFKMKAETSGCHSDLTLEIPVYLGTVPFNRAGVLPTIQSSVPLFSPALSNPSMPFSPQPFYPSMPQPQPSFNPSMPQPQPSFNPFMQGPQPQFNPSMPLPDSLIDSPTPLLPSAITPSAPPTQLGWAQ